MLAPTVVALFAALPAQAQVQAMGAEIASVEPSMNAPAYATASANRAVANEDPRFKALHSAWTQLDRPQLPAAAVSIPSRKPVDQMQLTSDFGTRSDPFSGRAARHNGIDIPGAIGTPIYATADGLVGKAEWFGGYGKYVSIDHGNAIETRYGHLSEYIVRTGQRVRRGQVIGFMGSTGRSTGSHLHYEVRIAGSAVNPMNFVQPTPVAPAPVQMAQRSVPALGGPTGR